jgi:hypothetical protein
MKTRVLSLIALAVAALVLGVVVAQSTAETAILGIARQSPGALRAFCARPATLHLARFEDGSAQLRCASHILVRVVVPG